MHSVLPVHTGSALWSLLFFQMRGFLVVLPFYLLQSFRCLHSSVFVARHTQAMMTLGGCSSFGCL
jgi:hypothetical protein